MGFFAYSFFTAIQFFAKKRHAVPMMLGFYALNMTSALVVVDAGRRDFELGRAFGTSLIWITYFLRSKRVERTFTR